VDGGGTLRQAFVPAFSTAVGLLALTGFVSGVPCVPTGVQYGVWTTRCPATDLRASVVLDVEDVERGRWGAVEVRTTARWMSRTDRRGRERKATVGGPDVLLDLVDGEGTVVGPLELRNADWSGDRLRVEVRLPDVPDGDYRLRAKVDAGFEAVEVHAEIPLYRPALVHVVTDRPLYEADQTVEIRAAVLGRSARRPIADRPGRWRILDPSRQELLVERAKTDAWGVASTSFPLAVDASEGTWTAVYETGDDRREVPFDVRPFTLPRFTVEARANARWHGPDDALEITGVARYTSGAPVQDGRVALTLAQLEGRWPVPLAWEDVPEVRTDADGAFTFDLGRVPADLIERARFAARIAVTDPTGERQPGATTLTLSADPLRVQAVTAFDGGLVADRNNRVYLRATTPDGRPLADTALTVTNPYDPQLAPVETTTDADGVASLQVDPGEPVSIVVPPPPFRERPFTPAAPQLVSIRIQPGDRAPSLAERRALDRVLPAIASCGDFAVGDHTVELGVQVAPSGRIERALGPDDAQGRCVVDAVRGLVFPPGERRTAAVAWRVPDTWRPALRVAHRKGHGASGRVDAAIDQGALTARRCLTRGEGTDGAPVGTLHWFAPDRGPLAVQFEPTRTAGLDAATTACIQRTIEAVALDEPVQLDALGAATLTLQVPRPPGTQRPTATTETGFQLRVEAASSTPVATTATLPVGALPPLRVRATPSLARAGDALTVELLRGPLFVGDLPPEVVLRRGSEELAKGEVDPAARTASLVVPDDAEGFLAVEAGGFRTAVFVTPAQPLSVALTPDAPSYRPGATATLAVSTRAGDAPVDASVTLAGVDATLAQLAPLTPVDDWGDVVVAATGEDAFGTFGPRALELGLVRGENAARAAILLVDDLGLASAEGGVWAGAAVHPPLEETLTTNFYRALEALIAAVRAWEASAPADAELQPATVAELWDQVLAESPDLVDGYGRSLELPLLPPDLLAQVAPAQVVGDSTRLPEDVLNWPTWVEENR
jgi:hypothetical protein